MKSKILEFIKKNKRIILYLIFGGITTLINIGVFWLCERILGLSLTPSNIIAWVTAVIFAFVTNKIYVFESKNKDTKLVLKELGTFIFYRLISGGIDMGIMLVGVDLIHIDSIIVKIVSNVVVVILNYIASKYIIFRKK